MASQRIRLNPSQVRSLSRSIRALNSDSKKMLKGVQQEIDETQQVWKGNAAEKYAREFTDVRKDVEKQMDKCLVGLADALDQVSKAMIQMEKEIANSINF